jgi:formate hydrogenlyase subunit 3/multisubunit Na+/H+ antiporter MnhD subunit
MMSVLFMIALVLPALMACAAFAGLLRGRMMRVAMLAAPLPAFLTALRGSNAGSVRIGDWIFTMDVSGAMLMGSAALLWMAAGVFVSRGVLGNAGFRRFCGCWFLTMTGSLGVFVAADLIGFLTMYALASLPAYGMVTHDGTPSAKRAGAAYLGCSLAGETLLVSGFVLLAMNSPGHSLMISDAVAALPESPWKHLTIAVLLAGFAMKMGLVPMHFWLPLAHPAAPAAGSAVLSGAIIKAGVIGLVRFLPLDTPMPGWGIALAWAGLVTALYGVIMGMTQSYAKTILAYSSVSQMGVVAAMLGMALASGDSSVGADASFYAMHHLFAKGGLFLAVGLVAATGLCRKWLVFLPCALLALGMAGLPFTGGALAKITSKSVLGSGMAATMAGVSAAGTAMLMLHFLRQLWHMERPEKRRARDLMAAFWALAVIGVVVRWAVYKGAGFGEFEDPFAAKTILKSLVPIAAGCVGFLIMTRVRLPAVPAGDLVNCFSGLHGLAEWCGRISARGDFGIRRWTTAAGILLATVVLIGALIFLHGSAG